MPSMFLGCFVCNTGGDVLVTIRLDTPFISPTGGPNFFDFPKHFPRRSGGSCTLFEDLGAPSLSRALARSASEKLPGTARRFFPTSPTRLLAPRLRPSALAFHVKEAP